MLKTRKLLDAVRDHLPDKRYTIITGARQVGKTSLLRLLFQELKLQKVPVFLLSFEDSRVLEAINEHPDRIFQFLPMLPLPILDGIAPERMYLMIDEIQYAKDPTNCLKFLFDKYEDNLKIIATGSSAFYIDRKFKDSLAGRKRVFNLLPLSFDEFIAFKDAQQVLEELVLLRLRKDYQSTQQVFLKNLFYEYLSYGGYPAVVLEKNDQEKKYLLEELKNAYVKRDILESSVAMEHKFYLLFQILADQIGNLVNKHELAKIIQVDDKTIDHYLYVLEKCYHLHLIKPFFRNVQKELTKMPKVYFNDLGLRNALLNRYGDVNNRSDKGALLENYYFSQFRHQCHLDQIHFWRTADGQEIDLILEESFETGNAYEVKWNKEKFHPAKYDKFLSAYQGFTLACLDEEAFWKI
ncbi:MAG TPA: ATP-binding protein [Saprospiraceae bacterium]|nr:ATP-binding protein [Saprospiraceae bacterium]HMQ85490.1 ATP-binding protein [Saprospiraceae bacterium]